MKFLRRLVPLALSLALLLLSMPVALALDSGDESGPPVRVLVRARPDSELARDFQRGEHRELAGGSASAFRLLSDKRAVASLSFDDRRSALRALAELQRDPDVLFAEIDQPRRLLWEPLDEADYDLQREWVEQIDLPGAWNITTGGESVVVAIVDSGVSPTHPDLQGKLVDGYNAVGDSDSWADNNGHGTHVAGIIAAAGSNGVGTAGAAMDVKIMPIRVLNNMRQISIQSIADGIYWAVDHGADVINLSLGAESASQIEQDAVRYAYENGIPVLAAAGNKATRISYPASYPESISIGALDANGNRATFSSVISRVDVAAPGVLIYSPHWSSSEGDSWSNVVNNQPVSGTSFSVAIASGVVALLRSINGDLGPEEVRQLLTSTATDAGEPGNEPGVGAGQIDAEAALRMIAFQAMYDTWYPADSPVASGQVQRTWLWGVDPPPYFAYEEYVQTEHGMRLVYYYDKSRMEITDPLADRSQGWYVTNGLLVNELVTGEMQVGDAEFVERAPAQVNVAGDQDDSDGPTYATFAGVLDAPAVAEGFPISQTISRDGTVSTDNGLISYGVTGGYFEETTGHRVASVFWEYLNSTGPLAGLSGLEEGPLFDPWFFATGLPITEAYWADVKVAGNVQDVLMQCFERRCLTYTPANPAGWRVEMGNVGLHYYAWRYGETPEPPAEEPPDEPEPAEPPARSEALFTAGFDVWSSAETDEGTRTLVEEGYLIDVFVDDAEIGVLVPQMTFDDAVVEATVRVMAGETGALCVVARRTSLDGSRYQGCVAPNGDVSLTYISPESSETLVAESGYLTAEQLAAGVEIAVLSQGETHWLEVNGQILGSAEHATLPEGSAGLLAIGTGTFLITDFAVYGAS